MKKIVALVFTLVLACSGLFADGNSTAVLGKKSLLREVLNAFSIKEYKREEKLAVLAGYTAMEMDMAVYGNTVYEALIAMNHTDAPKGTSIFINKYVDNVYTSTLQIDVEGFWTWEFSENFSHYDFLKLYTLSQDEFILTLYSSYSDNRFAFFRIRDGKVVSYKTYSLKKQMAYEAQRYAFNGKDRIYVAFNGQHDFSKSGWDLFVVAFDLDGNLKKAVTVYTKKNDDLNELAAAGDRLYMGIWQSYEKQAILEFTKDLEFEGCFAAKYDGGYVGSWTLDSDPYSDSLVVTSYSRKDDADCIARYSADGTFIGSCISKFEFKNATPSNTVYDHDDLDDDAFYLSKKRITDRGIAFFGQISSIDNLLGKSKKEESFMASFMDWEGNKAYEYVFDEKGLYNIQDFALVDGKYFCSGVDIYTADGIGHIYYTYLVDGDKSESDFMTFEKSDLDPLAIPDDPKLKALRQDAINYWEESIFVEDEEVPAWDFSYSMKKIRLNFSHAQPDSDEIRSTIPLFPFSER